MSRIITIWASLLILTNIIVGVGVYKYARVGEAEQVQYISANAQAMLAFAHYKTYSEMESLLDKKCHQAALTIARAEKHSQVRLLADNLRRMGTDPEFIDYLRLRDPQLTENILAGRVPEYKPYQYTCP